MNLQTLTCAALAALCLLSAGCQPRGTATVIPGTPAWERYSGNIAALDPAQRLVRVKLIFRSRVFAVATDCVILIATRREAGLTDLAVGDPVDLWHTPHPERPVARQIVVKGVTPDDKAEARDRDRLDRILTPSPTER